MKPFPEVFSHGRIFLSAKIWVSKIHAYQVIQVVCAPLFGIGLRENVTLSNSSRRCWEPTFKNRSFGNQVFSFALLDESPGRIIWVFPKMVGFPNETHGFSY